MTTVLLVDDQPLMRMGFQMVLSAQEDLDVIGQASNGAEAVALAQELRPDVVLMDVRMPVLDGVAATAQIVAKTSSRVLIMTTFDLDEYVLSALRNGASGFLLKDTQPAELVAGIRAVASGDAVVAPSVTKRLLDRFVPQAKEIQLRDRKALDVLTEREHEVMVLMGKGLSNGEISQKLFLSEATVKTHVGRILSKLGVRDRVQVVVLAYETGVITPGES
jgi:DNA-binding NarL/FixJ family response regulator